MIINFKKIAIRIFVGLLMLGIFGYIFMPSSEDDTLIVDTTIASSTSSINPTSSSTTTTTTIALQIVDPPCLVLYEKNKDTPILMETACVDTYVEKYINGYYNAINIICRSSGDGNTVDRQVLSSNRMRALQFNLMQKGVDYVDINSESVGDQSPYPGINPDSEDGKIINRSCEITGTLSE